MQKHQIRERFEAEALEVRTERKVVEFAGAQIHLRRLGLRKIAEANKRAYEGAEFDYHDYQVALFLLAAEDEAGERVFEDTDREVIEYQPGMAMQALLTLNLEWQGVDLSAVAAGKDDSPPTPSAGPSPSSAGTSEDSPASSKGTLQTANS